jgi:Flp pilus assembly protein TadB
MTTVGWCAAIGAATAVALLFRPSVRDHSVGGSDGAGLPPGSAGAGWMRRWRGLLALSAAMGAVAFLGPQLGVVAAPVAGVATWIGAGRVEPADVRRARERAGRELPHLVRLLGVALASGAPPADALEIVAEALPGPAADRLLPVAVRLRLGADPVAGWTALNADPALAPLGRALARAEEGGVSVVASVARLADDLARRSRADVEQRARAVGVKAAAPLGLCLLPSFLLVGIVPLVGGLLSSLRW